MSNISTFDEETARAEVYGLLAALLYAPPTPELLAQLRVAVTQAPQEGGFLEESWRDVVASSRELSDQQIASEHAQLFGGVGKPEVYLFGSHYLSGFLNEKPLVRLRTALTKLGIERDEAMPETEDHFAYCCEVMRFLIAGEDVSVSNLTNQKEFFAEHVQPWAAQMCDALQAHHRAVFYARLAGFMRAFISIEMQGFDMLA
ncbi:molecular chaperone TorD family protein [Variovorax sp. PCZ-1]|uniref:TorD/DmsD family molecular chaperone n=1 Tax=Variovorax sp. PCZ-1 TaxID=2835533 RepID=UPI001BD10CF1|nr:molecular chaperone TorD family protein [Variovorax sp. PCZ-1]MBS7807588.1 molecular chaperone TorD family protein [Variovorax sp. PCZ-1]